MALQPLEVMEFCGFIVSDAIGGHEALVHGAGYLIEAPDLLIVGMKRGHVFLLWFRVSLGIRVGQGQPDYQDTKGKGGHDENGEGRGPAPGRAQGRGNNGLAQGVDLGSFLKAICLAADSAGVAGFAGQVDGGLAVRARLALGGEHNVLATNLAVVTGDLRRGFRHRLGAGSRARWDGCEGKVKPEPKQNNELGQNNDGKMMRNGRPTQHQ